MQRDKTKDRRDWRSDYISAGLEFSPLVPGSHSAQCHRRNALEDGLHDSGRRAREGSRSLILITLISPGPGQLTKVFVRKCSDLSSNSSPMKEMVSVIAKNIRQGILSQYF